MTAQLLVRNLIAAGNLILTVTIKDLILTVAVKDLTRVVTECI